MSLKRQQRSREAGSFAQGHTVSGRADLNPNFLRLVRAADQPQVFRAYPPPLLGGLSYPQSARHPLQIIAPAQGWGVGGACVTGWLAFWRCRPLSPAYLHRSLRSKAPKVGHTGKEGLASVGCKHFRHPPCRPPGQRSHRNTVSSNDLDNCWGQSPGTG